ncbi:ABC transporter permease [Paeniglutamicibacter cryotolerans]|uniref:Iron complex transport system permease protein n=1 Tax=Paeniglutamicibacter cryotolerans TaxID=670079 RepID=A0A839QI37_9MICC|nr:ABC transporter permease [Paeniglutamicibacter cryotolerans]MBB2994404.1 iron complex transport system permease protein [Paeniglutamicibacter cryotolerans]
MLAPALSRTAATEDSSAVAVRRTRGPGEKTALALGALGVLVLAVISIFVGVTNVSAPKLLAGDLDAWQMLWVSRLPRTLAVVLAGTAVAVAGLIMQLMVRNRFVEPSTVGTVESATLGILVVTVAFPAAPLLAKMGIASLFALGGTALFLAVLSRLPLRNTLIVPIVGIMLGGVIGSVTTFFAYRYDLLQTLSNWMIGDFSGVLRGRYELLWIVAALTIVGYIAADRFTVAGMGADFTTNLGMNYQAIMRLGLVIVSLISAVVVTTVGAVPFLGLIVPNIVSLLFGDNLRRAVPWTAIFGAGFVLICDIIGRTIRFPYEVPVGMVMSVLGAIVFLALLLKTRTRNA